MSDKRLFRAGSGCPEGTATVEAAPDGHVLTVRFDRYVVSEGQFIEAYDLGRSLECQIRVAVENVPVGYTYAVRQVEFIGNGEVVVGADSQFWYRYSMFEQYPFPSLPSKQVLNELPNLNTGVDTP